MTSLYDSITLSRNYGSVVLYLQYSCNIIIFQVLKFFLFVLSFSFITLFCFPPASSVEYINVCVKFSSAPSSPNFSLDMLKWLAMCLHSQHQVFSAVLSVIRSKNPVPPKSFSVVCLGMTCCQEEFD